MNARRLFFASISLVIAVVVIAGVVVRTKRSTPPPPPPPTFWGTTMFAEPARPGTGEVIVTFRSVDRTPVFAHVVMPGPDVLKKGDPMANSDDSVATVRMDNRSIAAVFLLRNDEVELREGDLDGMVLRADDGQTRQMVELALCDAAVDRLRNAFANMSPPIAMLLDGRVAETRSDNPSAGLGHQFDRHFSLGFLHRPAAKEILARAMRKRASGR